MAAVRWGTFSRYGHAAICETVNSAGSITIIEPMPGGCRRRVAHPREFVWSDVPLTDDDRADIVAYAQSTIGLPYDWPAIFGFVLRWWAHRLTPWRRKRTGAQLVVSAYEAGGDILMCSEQSVRGYRRRRIDLGRGRPANAVSPGDLRQWLDDQRRAVRRPPDLRE